MKLSCATLTIEGFDANDFSRTIDLAPKAGYTFLELNLWHIEMLNRAFILDAKKRFDDAGLQVSSLHIDEFASWDRSSLTINSAHKFWMMDIANLLGASTICAGGPDRGTHGAMDGMCLALEAVLPQAEEMGITIALENHAGNTLENIDDYKTVFSRFDSSKIGLCLDTGHFEAAGIRVADVARELKERIVHVHLKENLELGKKTFAPFLDPNARDGAGIDHTGLLEQVSLGGYDEFAVIEISAEEAPWPLEIIAAPVHFYRPWF